jgi:hypothetical protein
MGQKIESIVKMTTLGVNYDKTIFYLYSLTPV